MLRFRRSAPVARSVLVVLSLLSLLTLRASSSANILGFLNLHAALAFGNAWPMLGQNPQHTGNSPFTGPQSLANPTIFDLAVGQSSISDYGPPIIAADGTVYVVVNGTTGAQIVAIDSSGNTLPGWPYVFNGITLLATPVLAPDGTLYAPSGTTLYAINPDGTTKWTINLGQSLVTSPAIAPSGTLYISARNDSTGGGTLFVVDPNGQLLWSRPGIFPYESPAVDSAGTAYFFGTPTFPEGGLTAVNLDGSTKWEIGLGGSLINPRAVTTPVISNGVLYTVQVDYPYPPAQGELTAFNLVDGSILYQRSVPGATSTGSSLLYLAVMSDETVLLLTGDHRLLGFSPDLNTVRLDYSFASFGPGTPVAVGADDTIYLALDGDGNTTRILALGSNGLPKDELVVTAERFGPGSIANDGTLYMGSSCCLGDGGKLYAFHAQNQAVGEISVTTNLPSATFDISGPTTYSGTGTAFSVTNAPLGDYTISYGNVAGYLTPVNETRTLVSGATISFTGTYIVACSPPMIATNPISQTITLGQSATLNVIANGTAPFAYQWYEGSAGDVTRPLIGKTSSLISVSPTQTTTAYWVRVTSLCGSVDTLTASITVLPVTHIQVAPFSLDNECQLSSEFGTANTRVDSDAPSGALSLDVQARKVGKATGRSGVGFDYPVPFSGSLKLTAHVAIVPPSSDIVWLLHPIPWIGPFGEVSLESDVYIEVNQLASVPSVASTIRKLLLTPLNPGPVVAVPNIYRRPQQFVTHLITDVTAGRTLRVCAGVRAKAVSAAPFGFLANSQAKYNARVIRITLTSQ